MANSTRKAVSTEATKGKVGTTTKPRARKSTAKKPAAKRVATRKASARKPLAESERLLMIAEAAYYLAQKRGFSGGDPVSDWIAAESEIETRLGQERTQ